MTTQRQIIIIGNFPPPYGGVQRHIERLIPFLKENGWAVQALSSLQGKKTTTQHATFHRSNRISKIINVLYAISDPWFWVHAPACLGSLFPRYFKVLMKYIALYGQARQICTHGYISLISAYNLFLYAPVAALLSARYNIPFIITNFGEIHSEYEFCLHNKKMVEYITKQAAVLLAMSAHCGKSYERIGLSPKVKNIPYGVDINLFNTMNDGSSIRSAYDLKPTDCVVLYLARITADMGIDTFLEAIPECLQRSDTIRFIIAGEKGDRWEKVCQLQATLGNRVSIAGRVPFDKLPLYYAAADIVVAPTQGDRACGSLSSLEAMATGKPVIGASVGGIPEIIINNETGILVKPGDPQLLAQAIINLAKDPERMKQLGVSGRKRVELFFDERKQNKELVDLFAATAR